MTIIPIAYIIPRKPDGSYVVRGSYTAHVLCGLGLVEVNTFVTTQTTSESMNPRF